MAPTFRPYQSVGQGLNQLNLPQGAEAQEASRTMTVLGRSLDQMAQFAFKRLDEQARVEGERFGVEFMTDEKIKEALTTNKDIFDLPQFGNTTFGKQARQSALQVLENDIIVNATKEINNLSYQATLQGTSPLALRNQIESTIIGYTDSIRPSAPILSRKLQAQLELQGHREYNSYRSSFSKGTSNELMIKSRNAVNTKIKELGSSILDKLYNDGKFNRNDILETKNKFISELAVVSPLAKFTKTEVEEKLLDFDKQVETILKNKMRDYVLTGNQGIEKLNKIIDKLPTGDDKLDQALYGDERPVFVNDDSIGKIVEALKVEVRFEREVQNNRDIDDEKKRKDREEKALRLFGISTRGVIDHGGVKEALEILDEVNPDKAKEKRDLYNKTNGFDRLNTNTESIAVRSFLKKAITSTGNLTYSDLELVENDLSGADYEKYDKIIDGLQKFGEKGYNSALAQIVTVTRYSENMVYFQKDKKNKITLEEYTKLKTKLDEKLFEVTTNNQEFDFQTFSQQLTEGVRDRIDGLIKESVIEDLKDTLDNYRIKYTTNFGEPPSDPKRFAKELIRQIDRVLLIEDNNTARVELRKLGIINQETAQDLKSTFLQYLEDLE